MTLTPWTQAQWTAAAKALTPKRLRARRLQRLLTLEQVGDAIGVKRSTVSRWENGDRDIPPLALRSLVQLLDIDI
jgi:transcriptional regulator with XRE-family HTH domain